MNPLFSLAASAPIAPPLEFEFEGRRWRLFHVDTVGVAGPLERWVCQFVRANVEKLRPDDDNEDPTAWDVYAEDKKKVQTDIARGLYGALTRGWESVVLGTDPGFEAAIFYGVRFKDAEWTWDHARRLLADDDRKAALYAAFLEQNYPKAKAGQVQPAEQEPATGPTETTSTPSSGPTSSGTPSESSESPPPKSTGCD